MAKLEKKKEIVESLAERFSRSQIVIVTDYRGLSVSEISELRRRLREAGIEYKVVKNTLAGLAAARAGKSALPQLLKGPVALAFGYEEVAQPAKALLDWQKSSETPLSIRGGLLGERLLSAEEVQDLATLPSREELLAKLTGAMQAPIYGLVSVLGNSLRALTWMLQTRIQQLEGG